MQCMRKKYLAARVIAVILAGSIPTSVAQAGVAALRGSSAGLFVEQVCRDGARLGLVARDADDATFTIIADRNTGAWNGDGSFIASRTVTAPEVNPEVAADYGADDPNRFGFQMNGHATFFTLRWSPSLPLNAPLRIRVDKTPDVHDPPDLNYSDPAFDAIPDPDEVDDGPDFEEAHKSVVVEDCRLTDLGLSIGDSPDPVKPGGQLTYTYNLVNLGSSDAVSSRTFANTASINISNFGAASLYPSNITIPAGTFAGGITNVQVTLQGIDHPATADLDVLLVSPTGQRVMLMSDAAGSGSISSEAVTLDDAAADYVPEATTNIGNRRYKPTNYGNSSDPFPAPAPAAPYATSLSAFNTTNPNGTWRLYVVDDTGGNSATYGQSISRGWAITITTNRIPVTVTVKTALPAGTTFVSGNWNGWACNRVAAQVTCSRDVEAPATVPGFQVTVIAPGTSTTLVTTAEMSVLDRSWLLADPGPGTKYASVTTLVGYGVYLPFARK